MACQSWSDQLTEIIVPFETMDAIDPEAFWDQLEGQTAIFPEARRLFFERLIEERQEFIIDLRDLARQEQLDDQMRREHYGRLARYYDCVFQWEEEREAGVDNIEAHSDK
jgi:hypothetical protein